MAAPGDGGHVTPYRGRAAAVRAVVATALALMLGGCDYKSVLAGITWPWDDEPPSDRILLSGTVEAREHPLAFRVGGRIESLEVEEGQRVEIGDTLARLERQDLQIELERARREAEAAAAALAALEAGTRPEELRVAMSSVSRAEAELELARSDVARLQKLVQRRLASQEEYDRAQSRLKVTRAQLEEAEQRLALAREGPRQEDIRRARAQHEASLAAVELAGRRLQYTLLASPVSGIVSVRRAEPGEVVASGQPVVTVAALDRPWVRAFLPEPHLARVQLGQPAAVTVDGLGQRRLEGRLSFIAPDAEFTPKTVQTQELRVDLVYRVRVDVDNADGILKIGMPADIVLEPVR